MSQPMIQITITLDDVGQVNVNGPLENTMGMLGLLEVAKMTVVDYAKANARRVQPAPSGLVIPKI